MTNKLSGFHENPPEFSDEDSFPLEESYTKPSAFYDENSPLLDSMEFDQQEGQSSPNLVNRKQIGVLQRIWSYIFRPKLNCSIHVGSLNMAGLQGKIGPDKLRTIHLTKGDAKEIAWQGLTISTIQSKNDEDQQISAVEDKCIQLFQGFFREMK